MQDLASDEATSTVVEENTVDGDTAEENIDAAESTVRAVVEDDSFAPLRTAVATPTPARSDTERTLLEWLTVERMLFGLCILIGAGLRFFGLATQPLSSAEAATAWASWLAANGFGASNHPAVGMLSATTPATSPLLYSLNSILFWLAGGGDALARFLPALFGTGMVMLTWYLRPHLGRWVALALALLFAIDPWLVAYSRLVDGTILSAFFGLLALIGLLNLRGSTTTAAGGVIARRWMSLTALGIGLLLVSGVQAWNFIPVLLLCFWLCCGSNLAGLGRSNPVDGGDDVSGTDSTVGLAVSSTWWGLIAAAALLGATGWLAFPEGLSYLSTSLSGWIAQFSGGEVGYSLGWLRLRVLVDQPLLLIFGVIGLVTLLRLRTSGRLPHGWSLFILLWAVWGVLVVLLPGRMPTSLLMLELPLLFAAAQVIGSLGQAERPQNWGEVVLFVGVLTALIISAWIMLILVVHDGQFQFEQARILMLPIAAIVVSLIFFMLWASWRQMTGLGTGFFVALLAVIALSSTIQLSHRFDAAAPDAFFEEYSSSDVRALAENVAVLSSQRTGDPIQATVHVALDSGPDPLLGWYLRKMQNLEWGAAAPASVAMDDDSTDAPFLISYQDLPAASDVDSSVDDARAPAGYLGSEYGLRYRWLPTELPTYLPVEDPAVDASIWDRVNARWGVELRPLFRWMLYREVSPPPAAERAVLWVPVIEN